MGRASFSFCELAAVFYSQGYRLVDDEKTRTFRDVCNLIRKAMLTLSKMSTVENSTRPRSCGRTLPQGCIDAAIPFVAPEGFQLVANLFARGAGRALETWEIPVCDF